MISSDFEVMDTSDKQMLAVGIGVFLTIGFVFAASNTGTTNPQNNINTGPSQTPEQVVESYMTSFVGGNTDSAYELLSSKVRAEERTEVLEQKQRMDSIHRTMGRELDPRLHNVEQVSKTNETAQVEIEVDLYARGRYARTYTKTVDLSKENGEWRLDEMLNPYSQES